MNNVLAHRGPDDSDLFYSSTNRIGLAHRRLSIIDVSSYARQPMWDYSKSIAIVFNGEIYNYKKLRAELILDGYQFNNHSDTEVILNLYLKEGVELLYRLNGIFSFALLDTCNNFLFVARDGVGVKPLYYSENRNGFLFASEIKAILLEASIERSIDYGAIHNYLSYLWCPAPKTPIKNIKKLEPGHALLVKDGKIEKRWQFYELPYHQPISQISQQEAISEVTDSLIQAVKRQMVADVEVGAFLSGGLDSSSIVAFAQNVIPDRKMKCFTIEFTDNSLSREGMVDDLSYAKQVAEHLEVDLYRIKVESNVIEHLEKMIYHLDEPQADPAPINVMLICNLARQLGVKVLLSGAGGDDIFTGYRRHYALVLEKYWDWLPKSCRGNLTNLTHFIPKKTAIGRRLAKAFQYSDLDGDYRIESYFNWQPPGYLQSLYSKEFLNELNNEGYNNPLVTSLSNLPANILPLNRMLFLDSKYFLSDHNLNYTDKMSMAVGVEVRVPFLDPDLVSLAARLPLNFKQHGKEGKWILKKAMEPFLPHNVIYRPKSGFGAPLRSWLRNELRPVVESTLSNNVLLQRGFFNPKSVSRLLEDDRRGRIDGTYTIFSLMCIEIWCRLFLDKKISSMRF